jgi:O-acetylhomoserine (thiol)-lyase
VQAGWQPKNGEPRVLPIFQSTTFKYDSADYLGKLSRPRGAGHFYTRAEQPHPRVRREQDCRPRRWRRRQLTSSGQAASLFAILNLCKAGDHVVSTVAIYGGTFNLFAVTLRRFGIEFTFVNQNDAADKIAASFRPTPRRSSRNRHQSLLEIADLEKLAAIAHGKACPSSWTTPSHADPVPAHRVGRRRRHPLHDQVHGRPCANRRGVVVDAGTFAWTNGKFPEFCEPDPSYHGISYAKRFGAAAFIVKARVQLQRDIGAQQSPFAAYVVNLGLETLHLRMPRHCSNALAVARHLEKHPAIAG